MPAVELPSQEKWRWWDCRRPLDRGSYALAGVLLMLVKYGGEMCTIWYATGRFYSPLDFINPLASARLKFAEGGPDWFTPVWLLWTVPFVAIAVLFTIRRALDAGRSPWWGLWILVPVFNFAVMATFLALPTAPDPELAEPSDGPRRDDAQTIIDSPGLATVAGIGVGAAYATLLTILSVYAFHSYGAALFFGTPIIAGAFAAFTYNFEQRRSWSASLTVAAMPVLCLGLVLLLFALEGAFCILLAAPIMLPLAIVGGVVGKIIGDLRRGDGRRRRELVAGMVLLPMLALGESRLPQDYEFCSMTSVDINAPPERVWDNVVNFPTITSRPAWPFRLGISGPLGARIDGQGVGAVRHCDFTTGSFVEPITVWDEPRRLAFDVTDQPEPMVELSPYPDIHPPHLKGTFRSTHGEFVLEPLPDGGTRLVGRTWYKLELAPHVYWSMWTDWIIHHIHRRVLEHVKNVTEASSN